MGNEGCSNATRRGIAAGWHGEMAMVIPAETRGDAWDCEKGRVVADAVDRSARRG